MSQPDKSSLHPRASPGRSFFLWGALTLCGLLVAAVIAQSTDTDQDGMSDEFEVFFGLNPTNAADAVLNDDADALTNLAEAVRWTDPFVADTDHDGWNDNADSNALSRAVIYWGDPQFTQGDAYDYPGPVWWLGAARSGGDWFSNTWHVAAAETNNTGQLRVYLDRTTLTNNLAMDVSLYDHAGSSLFVDLLDTNALPVVTNLFGNILLGSNEVVTVSMSIPLSNHIDAATIVLRRGSGEATIYDTLLYVDEDGDGLDADQEAQLGTSDHNADSDGDGLNDYAEADTDGDGVSNAEEIRRGTDPFDADDLNVTLYTDAELGEDSYDGLTNVWIAGVRGPKWHIAEAINVAVDGDTIQVAAGCYQESSWNLGTRAVVLRPVGDVWIYTGDPVGANKDNDGMPDDWEFQYRLNPHDPSDAAVDTDDDGLVNSNEYTVGTNPRLADTDGDGLEDGDEILVYHTDPLLNDTDADGLPDAWEAQYGMTTNRYDDALIGWWQFDQSSTNLVFDRGPYALTGTMSNLDQTAFVVGIFSNALAFGTNSWVEFPVTSHALDLTNSFTVSMWVWGANATTATTLAAWEDLGGHAWELGLGTNGAVRWVFYSDGSNVLATVTNESQPTNVRDGSQWHQVAGVYDAASTTATVYVDGILEASRVVTNWASTNAVRFVFGNVVDPPPEESPPGAAFAMDEARLYGLALSADEIATLPNTYDDPDQDGLNNAEEFAWGTDPTNPDTDGDGMDDRLEVLVGRDPTKGAVSDSDGSVDLKVYTPLEGESAQ